jgi:hypothetical protein
MAQVPKEKRFVLHQHTLDGDQEMRQSQAKRSSRRQIRQWELKKYFLARNKNNKRQILR